MRTRTVGVKRIAVSNAACALLYPGCSRGAPGKNMALTTSQSIARPAKDEWGLYDPQQAGLAALFARLDAKETITPAPHAPEKKEMSDYPAPVGPQFRDE